MGLVYVRGVLCVGTVLLFGTGLISRFSCCGSPHSLGMGSSCSARETNLRYVTRGLGLLLSVASLLCLFLFPAPMMTGMLLLLLDANLPILWLISSILERAVEVLDE